LSGPAESIANESLIILQNPEYVLIKSWVPEETQDILWQHTRYIREQRSHGGRLIMSIDEKEKHKHHHMHNHLMPEPEFEWVRKKEHKKDRKRSKSPSMLLWMAGGRPA